MKNELQQDLLCIWCVAHRSDLAFSDLEESVAEIKHWCTNIKSIATFYRASARTNALKDLMQEADLTFYRFPEYFEVRFVEHLVNLCSAVWKNLPGMCLHWQSIQSSATASKTDKATAKGFMKLWAKGSDQVFYTAVMMDILHVFENLQKACQKAMAILTDIEVAKNACEASLNIMVDGPYPGGLEEEFHEATAESDEDEARPRRSVGHTLVTTRRSKETVRAEMVMGAREYLSQRMSEEQSQLITSMKEFLNSRNLNSMITACREIVRDVFGRESAIKICDELAGHFAAGDLPVPINITDNTGKLYHFLKIAPCGTVTSKLAQAYICLTPHSIGPERAVSCHTIIKTSKQSSYSKEAVNSRMYIALNGTGTAYFDPRPAVARFLQQKERRMRNPDNDLYKSKSFIKNFFLLTALSKMVKG